MICVAAQQDLRAFWESGWDDFYRHGDLAPARLPATCIVGFSVSGGLCHHGTTEQVRASPVWLGYSHGSGCHWHRRGSSTHTSMVIPGSCEAMGLWGGWSVSFSGNAWGVLAYSEADLANCWACYGGCPHGNSLADSFSGTTALVDWRRIGCHCSHCRNTCYFFDFRSANC